MASARWLGGCAQRSLMIEIIGKFRARFLLAIDDPGAEHRPAFQIGPQPPTRLGVFGEGFRQNVARALERAFDVVDLSPR